MDAAQTQGKVLLVPSGVYILTATLNVSCANEYCITCDYLQNCKPNTHQPLKMRGEGQMLTHFVAAQPMNAVLQLAGAYLKGSIDVQVRLVVQYV
jgi:hypothetical protein